MRSARRLLVLAAPLALALLSTKASAQATSGVTINVVQEASLPRLAADGSSVNKRALTLEPEGVSLQDCLDDQQIVFPLQLAGYVAQSSLEAWASLSGADCTEATTRSGGTQVCWQLSSGIPLEPAPRPAFRVRTILAGASADGVTKLDSSRGICGRVDLTSITVQFLYFAPGDRFKPATKKDITVRADTVGPDAPGGVSVLPGNTRIRISFGGLGEGGLSAYTGVRAYCDPSVAQIKTVVKEASVTQVCNDAGNGDADTDATDASDASDASEGDCEEVVTDEGGTIATTSTECASPNLSGTASSTDGGDAGTKALVPDDAFNAKYQCGSLAGNTGSALIAESLGGKPLDNDKIYAVAIAAIDQFGNVGPLSSVFCEKPERTTDFWENYKNAGGEAGGGFCSVEGAGLPVGSLTVTGIMAVALVGAIRRRRERAVSNPRDDRDNRSGR